MKQRGGPQHIPRPLGTEPGGRAPWHGLSAQRLTLRRPHIEARLRERGDGREVVRAGVEPEGNSAVLLPLYEDSRGETIVVLTRRSRHLRSHSMEVSFPGGRQDPGEDLTATALREAFEEIALEPESVTIIGELDRFATMSSGSLIHPYVGWLDDVPTLNPNLDEVEQILRVPLAELLAEEVFREERWPINGVLRSISFFELFGNTVWGATAAMLRQFLAVTTQSKDSLTY